MNRLRADALLLLSAIIWGTGFVAQKAGNESIGPITFVGARFLLSAIALLPLALYEARKSKDALTRSDVKLASIVGVILFAGSWLQQTGLLTTTATNGGFLTALYVVLVPFVAWLLTRERIRPFVLIAGAVCIAGAWLLTEDGQARTWRPGDALLLVADIAWAFSIALSSMFLMRTNRPFFLSFVQYAITAALGLGAALIFETPTQAGLEAAMVPILYAGLISGGLAFTLQFIALRYTPSSEAALILSLESVFAFFAGAMLLGERLSLTALTGCALILLGVVIAETGPALMRLSARLRADPSRADG
jgi:drug/metabolite transporter (DMT)-like permease